MDTSPHKSDFVNVNGIRLHYLDWGGSGPTLLFLAGLGCNAHIFDKFAPRFTDKFHVLALTRRGHGDSDYLETGYDIDTLTEDIRRFLDSLKIDKAILVGHSMASIELSHFAALYPERVLKMVFLDAAYNRSSSEYKSMRENNPARINPIPGMNDDYDSVEECAAFVKRAFPSLAEIWGEVMDEHILHEVHTNAEGKVVDKISDAISKAIDDTMTSYVPEDAKIQAPVLSFYAIKKKAYPVSPAYPQEIQAELQARQDEHFEAFVQPWVLHSIEQFRRDVPHAKVVEIPNGHHFCFIKQEELVYNEMRTFLLDD